MRSSNVLSSRQEKLFLVISFTLSKPCVRFKIDGIRSNCSMAVTASFTEKALFSPARGVVRQD